MHTPKKTIHNQYTEYFLQPEISCYSFLIHHSLHTARQPMIVYFLSLAIYQHFLSFYINELVQCDFLYIFFLLPFVPLRFIMLLCSSVAFSLINSILVHGYTKISLSLHQLIVFCPVFGIFLEKIFRYMYIIISLGQNMVETLCHMAGVYLKLSFMM